MKTFLFALLALLFAELAGAAPAQAGGAGCDASSLSTRCGMVTDREYGGGGSAPNVVPITVCLPSRMFESIKLRDGSAAWEAGFYYKTGKPEEVTTVRNSRCWTEYRPGVRQHGNPGSYAVAFICCDEYCGWVGGKVPANGRVDLRPIRLPAKHDPLRSCRAGNWKETGQYKRCSLLK